MKKLIYLFVMVFIAACAEEDIQPQSELHEVAKTIEEHSQNVDNTRLRAAADFRGRIKRVRIRERTNQRIIVDVETEGASPNNVGYALVKFEEPFEGPIPANTVIKADKPKNRGRGGKRFDWLEWDGTEMVGGSSIGFTYLISATLHDKKGAMIGEAFTQKVVVEAQVSKNETPKIVEFSVFSKDNGRTWNAILDMKDRGEWVEKVEVEFPEYEQVIPFRSVNHEESGATESYFAQGLNLRGLKAGQEVPVVVYFYGRGSRGSAAAADNRAELL